MQSLQCNRWIAYSTGTVHVQQVSSMICFDGWIIMLGKDAQENIRARGAGSWIAMRARMMRNVFVRNLPFRVSEDNSMKQKNQMIA